MGSYLKKVESRGGSDLYKEKINYYMKALKIYESTYGPNSEGALKLLHTRIFFELEGSAKEGIEMLSKIGKMLDFLYVDTDFMRFKYLEDMERFFQNRNFKRADKKKGEKNVAGNRTRDFFDVGLPTIFGN